MSDVSDDNAHSLLEGPLKIEYTHRYVFASQFVAAKDVLEIGSKEGHGSRILAEVAASVIGVDRDKDAVEGAKRDYAHVENLRFAQGSWSSLPIDDQSIDVVVSFDVSDHRRQHDELIAEVKRILRPNGTLLFLTINKSIVHSNNPTSHSPNIDSQHYNELGEILHRHFCNVAFFAQRSNIASFIHPIIAEPDKRQLQSASFSGSEGQSWNVPGMAVYFLIAASDDALPSSDLTMAVHSDLTASSDGYMSYALMDQLTRLQTDVDTSRRKLAAVQGSKFWKLRDAWFGVRDRRVWLSALLPPLQKSLWSLSYNRATAGYSVPAMKLMMATVVPPIQKILWGLAYDHLTTSFPTSAMTFMNLGYVGGADEPATVLDAIDEPSRLWIQLYHHVATQVDLTGQAVLEVGCGRGGGASYVKRYLGPSSMVGMDLADKAIDFCRQTHHVEGLRFVQGDAEKIPFDDQQFDVVVNVESSHCYPSVDAFFREVKRVLRSGGHFLYADVMPLEALPERRKMLNRAGLEIVQERDITSNILAALDSTADRRVAFEETLTTVFGHDGAREWAILPGSKTLDGMRAGTLCYVSMALRAGQPR